MRHAISIVLITISLWSSSVLAENIAAKVLDRIMAQKLPVVLYEHKEKPWELGIYSLTVRKNGVPSSTITDTQLRTRLPLEVTINARVERDIFGTRISSACDSRFLTDGIMNITPELKPLNSQAKVVITVPMADPQLDCDGLLIPIKPALEQLIAYNKAEWEDRIELEIATLFRQLGM